MKRPDSILVTARRTADGTLRVCMSTDTLPYVEFTCADDDLPALVDANLVGLFGMDPA